MLENIGYLLIAANLYGWAFVGIYKLVRMALRPVPQSPWTLADLK